MGGRRRPADGDHRANKRSAPSVEGTQSDRARERYGPTRGGGIAGEVLWQAWLKRHLALERLHLDGLVPGQGPGVARATDQQGPRPRATELLDGGRAGEGPRQAPLLPRQWPVARWAQPARSSLLAESPRWRTLAGQ